MIISIDTKKTFWQGPKPFYDRFTHKLRIERNILNMIKCIYEKPTANSVFNGERLKAFLQISETRQKCSLSPFYSTLEILARVIR